MDVTQLNRETGRLTDRQIDRRSDRLTDRQTDKQGDSHIPPTLFVGGIKINTLGNIHLHALLNKRRLT